jgi:hypothetical protein
MAPGKCLYEILDVSREADEDAIKKAYRKQALTWHPGMMHCVYECTEIYREFLSYIEGRSLQNCSVEHEKWFYNLFFRARLH